MQKVLKWLLLKRAKSSAGSQLPAQPLRVDQCYSAIDSQNRWQGDVYPCDTFASGALPSADVPYWMLLNRTCHLYAVGTRSIKLPFLNFAAVYPLHQYVTYEKKVGGNPVASLKNQVSDLVNGKRENAIYLPQDQNRSINEPLWVNFNLVFTVRETSCPQATRKILQLSSPFSEHVFQKYARFFYTVGYDDDHLKADLHVNDLVKYLETKRPKT